MRSGGCVARGSEQVYGSLRTAVGLRDVGNEILMLKADWSPWSEAPVHDAGLRYFACMRKSGQATGDAESIIDRDLAESQYGGSPAPPAPSEPWRWPTPRACGERVYDLIDDAILRSRLPGSRRTQAGSSNWSMLKLRRSTELGLR